MEDPPFTANNVGETTLTDPFLKTNPIISTFLVGLTSDLPGDAPGQQHLVLFTNTSWAQAAQHIAWGNFFGPLLEEDAISDVANVNWDSMFGDFTGLDQLNTSYAFAPGQAFDVIAFSERADHRLRDQLHHQRAGTGDVGVDAGGNRRAGLRRPARPWSAPSGRVIQGARGFSIGVRASRLSPPEVAP